MKWIDVKEKTPNEGEQVLVFGFKSTELSGRRDHKSIGLVDWCTETNSPCSDYCYYGVDYEEISHWSKIEQP